MVKIAVPIFAGGEFPDAFGGYGKPSKGETVDRLCVGKVIGIPQQEAERLAREIPNMTEQETREMADYPVARLHAVFKEARL